MKKSVVMRASLSVILILSMLVTWTDGISAETDFNRALLQPQLQFEQSAAVIHADGYVPSRLVLHQSPKRTGLYAEEPLPATYDLTSQNRVSPVKDQGSSGACWAFSAIGSMESCLLPLQLFDFSENNLKNESGFDLDPNAGGNNDLAIAYFARWGGPLSEADDPYDPYSTSSDTDAPAQVHVQDVVALPGRTGPTDNAAIKRAIMDYGAVSVSMYMGGQNATQIGSGHTSTYYSIESITPNHAVLLVGWIDGSSAANFTDYDHGNVAPPDSGAFIVKNSYGADWGSGGYFYISYYDVNLATDNSFVYPAADPSTNYAANYQHDPLGSTGAVTYGGDIWMSNIFTKQAGDGDLAAVSFYTLQTDTTYRVYVVDDYLSAADLTGGRTLTATGTLADCGYFTVDLDVSVPVAAGHQFAVIVQLTAAAASYAPIEKAEAGYSSAAEAQAGESFVSYDGSSWQDLTTAIPTANLCLKAFTASKSVTGITIKTLPNRTVFAQGSSLDLSGASLTANYSDGSQAEVNVTLDMASGFDMNTLGEQTVTITYGGSTTSFLITVVAAEFTDPATGLVVDLAAGTIIGYTGSPVNLVIPSMISGYTISAIGQEALANCATLKSVTIPGSVKTIGLGAFYGCSALSDLQLHEGVEVIGNRALGFCTSLRSTVLPESLTTLDDAVYYGSVIESIAIPANVQTINGNPFAYCTALTAIDVAPANPNYTSIGSVLFDKSVSKLIQYPVGKTATAYNVPGSVSVIGAYAFGYSTNLQSIVLPVNVSEIQAFAFFLCSELQTVNIPDLVTTINDFSFYYCHSLQSITIPDDVTSIGSYAFGICSSLESIIIPASVIEIEEYALYNCSMLTSVSIPRSVTTLGTGVFLYCSGLTAINVDSSNPNYISENGVLYNKSKTLLKQYPCNKPETEYIFPVTLTSMELSALALAKRLTTITVPSDNPNYASINGVLFNKTKELLIQYPIGKTSSSYDVPVGTTEIGRNAFLECQSIQSVTIPEGVTILGIAAFETCSYLKTINLPDSLTKISGIAFAFCNSLQTIIIPENVVLIEDYAFDNCLSLSKIYLACDRSAIGMNAFSNTASSLKIYYHISRESSWSSYSGYPTQAYCNVLLDLMDGSAPLITISDVVSGHISSPGAPTRTGYSFAGWYKDAGLTDDWNFPTDIVTSDITLYARWTATANITSAEIKINYDTKLLGPLSAGTTVAGLIPKLSSGSEQMVVKDRDGQVINDQNRPLATGMTIMINGQPDSSLTIVVKGDLTGDGAISALDLLQMKKYLLGQISMAGAYYQAARVTDNTAPSALDLLQIKKHLLGQISIK